MPKKFYISLKSIIKDSDDRILFMVKNRDGKNYLDLPGGRMEDNDSFESCIVRELKEELSIITPVKVRKQIGQCFELPTDFMRDNNRQLVLTFLVDANTKDVKLSNEHSEILWISLQELSNIKESGYILLAGYKDNIATLSMNTK